MPWCNQSPPTDDGCKPRYSALSMEAFFFFFGLGHHDPLRSPFALSRLGIERHEYPVQVLRKSVICDEFWTKERLMGICRPKTAEASPRSLEIFTRPKRSRSL